MPLKVAAPDELGEDVLRVDGHSAGIDGDLFLQTGSQCGRQDHVADTDARRDGACEGVHVDDAPRGLEGEEGVLCFGGHRELGVKIVLHDEPVSAGRPPDVAGAARCARGDAAGIAVERRDVQHAGRRSVQRAELHALTVHRQHLAADVARFVDQADLLIGRIFEREDPVPPQHLHDQVVQIFRARSDDDLLRQDADPAAARQVLRDGLPQKRSPEVRRAF